LRAADVIVDFSDVRRVQLEYTCGRFRADVAVLASEDRADPCAVLEVLVTHAVPDDKWRDLEAERLIEVRASDILQSLRSDQNDIEAVRIRGADLVCTRCRELLTTTVDFGKYRGRMLCDVEPRYLIDFLADSQDRIITFIETVVGNGCCRSCSLSPVSDCWCVRVIAAKTMSERERVLTASLPKIREGVFERSFIYVLSNHRKIRDTARDLLKIVRTDRGLCLYCGASLRRIGADVLRTERSDETSWKLRRSELLPSDVSAQWHRFCRSCWRASQYNVLDDINFRPIVSRAIIDSLQV